MLSSLKKLDTPFFVILSIPLLILSLPILVVREVVISFINWRIICKTACWRCGVILGRESIAESNRLISIEVEEFKRKFPNVKPKRLRRHDAVCIKCGQKYKYHGQGRCYLPVKENLSA